MLFFGCKPHKRFLNLSDLCSNKYLAIPLDRNMSIIRIPAKIKATSAIIFLHGLGDSGDGWSWFPESVEEMKIVKNSDSINYVFPTATEKPVTLYDGAVMHAWFDVLEGKPFGKEDSEGYVKACNLVRDLIKEQIEVYNIPAERIIIGGFSQGAATALGTVALLDFKIGGVIGLSGFCPAVETITKHHNETNFDTPVFQGHGNKDRVISYKYGQASSEFYKKLGFRNWEFKIYDGLDHGLNEDLTKDVMLLLESILGRKGKL